MDLVSLKSPSVTQKNMEKNSIENKKPMCELSEPSLELKDSYFSALKEYTSRGLPLDEGVANPGNYFAKFVQHLKDESQGINLEEGHVPQTTYWITDKDGYAGRVMLRHELNEQLLRKGGNMGYGIIPSKRGRGYATKALALGLNKARELGLKKVLLTCFSTNIGSKKVIEKNGGILENEVPGENGEPSRLRYWINL
jgi:predicted acetyltransferase